MVNLIADRDIFKDLLFLTQDQKRVLVFTFLLNFLLDILVSANRHENKQKAYGFGRINKSGIIHRRCILRL